MRAHEFIFESRSATLAADVARALPTTYVLPELKNQDPYMQYRFGLALVTAKTKREQKIDHMPQFERESAWGENLIISSIDPNIGADIDQALKQMGMSQKRMISSGDSEEAIDVEHTSPIIGFRGFK